MPSKTIRVETLAKEMKFSAVHVPQRGEAPGLQDWLTDTINCGWTSAGTARTHALSGKIVPLAMMGPNRSSALPNVPTFRELGVTDSFFDRSVWVAQAMYAEEFPVITKRLRDLGIEPG